MLRDDKIPAVTHMLLINAGAVDELPGESGVAHFLEHLLFKGTPKHPEGEFSRLVASFGGFDNAFTTQDVTAYYQAVPKQHLKEVMALEADRFKNMQFTLDELEVEREVVLEERRSRTDIDPRSRLMEQMRSGLFGPHPYGTPVIGWEEEIKALTQSDVMDFFKTYYQPEYAMVVFSGSINLDEAVALSEEYYGSIGASEKVLTREDPKNKFVAAHRSVELYDENVKQAEWLRLYRVPNYLDDKFSPHATSVLLQILGSGDSSRLYQSLVERKKLATYISASYYGIARYNGTISMIALPKTGVPLKNIETSIEEEIAAIVLNGISDEELQRAKRVLLAEYFYLQDDSREAAVLFGKILASGGSQDYITSWPDKLRAVSREDVRAAARDLLRRDHAVTGYLLPETENAW